MYSKKVMGYPFLFVYFYKIMFALSMTIDRTKNQPKVNPELEKNDI